MCRTLGGRSTSSVELLCDTVSKAVFSSSPLLLRFLILEEKCYCSFFRWIAQAEAENRDGSESNPFQRILSPLPHFSSIFTRWRVEAKPKAPWKRSRRRWRERGHHRSRTLAHGSPVEGDGGGGASTNRAERQRPHFSAKTWWRGRWTKTQRGGEGGLEVELP
jgi:hypothetical protein